jgi:hypothetical protein
MPSHPTCNLFFPNEKITLHFPQPPPNSIAIDPSVVRETLHYTTLDQNVITLPSETPRPTNPLTGDTTHHSPTARDTPHEQASSSSTSTCDTSTSSALSSSSSTSSKPTCVTIPSTSNSQTNIFKLL